MKTDKKKLGINAADKVSGGATEDDFVYLRLKMMQDAERRLAELSGNCMKIRPFGGQQKSGSLA